MRFGFMEDFRNPAPWRRPFPELYRAILDQIVFAEQLGYDDVWLTEHHFSEDGYNPALLPTAGAIAARTSRIRIGTFVLLLPFAHPLRVAEDATAVDILSNGRFDLGVGQGYSHAEFESFCVPRRERAARLEEGVKLLHRLFREDRVSFDGLFTQLRDVSLSPRPVQEPHLPVWIGARGEKAIRRAARLGCDLLCTLGPDPAPTYVEALREAGRAPEDFKIGQLRFVYVAETEDRAWEESQAHVREVLNFYSHILAEASDVPGDRELRPFERPEDLRRSPFAEEALIGSPEQVARKLERFTKQYRCTHFIMATQFPGLDPAKANRSFELFAREIMPAFRDA